MTARVSRIFDWIDERSGLKETTRHLLAEPIRGGARWAYVFGSILLFLLLLQVVTGILLTLYYTPSANSAHASVAFIQKAAPGGAFLRGLHHYGSSAMVIIAVFHLVQTFLFGAYKGKRELVWVAGVAMLLLIFGFAFTGYLLPWDQAAYFGTKVGTSIAGEIPVIGPVQQRILLGGQDLSTLTLSRFFTAHVFLLPLAIVLLAVMHVYLFRRARPAGPYHARDDQKTEHFYPRQLFKDAVAIGCCFVILMAIVYYQPAELGPPADPTSDYLARPPWYFLPLFQLLKYFPGRWSIIPTVILPGVVITALLGAPFLDRRAERHPRSRPLAMAILALVLLGAVGLMVLSKYEDRHDAEIHARLQVQDQEMRAFFAEPFQPRASSGSAHAQAPIAAATLNSSAPPSAYVENCADCHGGKGEGDSAPALIGITTKPQRTKADLQKLLLDARSYKLRKPMPPSFSYLSEEERKKIVDWLDSLRSQ
jgi:ubiquinol-cytochrome c reductase cytochrome b subunit